MIFRSCIVRLSPCRFAILVKNLDAACVRYGTICKPEPDNGTIAWAIVGIYIGAYCVKSDPEL